MGKIKITAAERKQMRVISDTQNALRDMLKELMAQQIKVSRKQRKWWAKFAKKYNVDFLTHKGQIDNPLKAVTITRLDDKE